MTKHDMTSYDEEISLKYNFDIVINPYLGTGFTFYNLNTGKLGTSFDW